MSYFQDIKTQLKTLLLADSTFMAAGVKTAVDEIYDFKVDYAAKGNIWLDMWAVNDLTPHKTTGIYTVYFEVAVRVNCKFGAVGEAEKAVLAVCDRLRNFAATKTKWAQSGYWDHGMFGCPQQTDIRFTYSDDSLPEQNNYFWSGETNLIFDRDLTFT